MNRSRTVVVPSTAVGRSQSRHRRANCLDSSLLLGRDVIHAEYGIIQNRFSGIDPVGQDAPFMWQVRLLVASRPAEGYDEGPGAPKSR